MSSSTGTKPLVSIVIPVFNDAAGVALCLRGIAAQSCPTEQIEVIVVDNGSEPPLAVKEQYLFELRILRHAKPGSYAARNAGVAISRGETLAFTDADCTPHTHWIEHGLNALARGHGRIVAGGEVSMVARGNPTATALYQTMVGFRQKENIEQRLFSVTANLFCQRADFDVVGPFNEDLLSGGDREWCWRARKKGIPAVYVPDAVVETPPRSTLPGAIRQARRVAAGRLHLARLQSPIAPAAEITPHRGVWASAVWILRHPDLGIAQRLQVLCVAILIRLSATLESTRLRLGGHAERK
jgi:glycosyltransferase involved in cell wall biosynthesis